MRIDYRLLKGNIPKEKLNLEDPVNGKDPVTKQYLDPLIENLSESITGNIVELNNIVNINKVQTDQSINELLAEQIILIDKVENLEAKDIEQDAIIKNNDEFVKEFGEKILTNKNAYWNSVASVVTGEGFNGGVVNIPNKSISVNLGSKGNASYLTQTFSLNNFTLGEKVFIRTLFAESIQNAIDVPNFTISVANNNVVIPVDVTVTEEGNNVIHEFSYIIQPTNNLKVTFTVGENSSQATSNVSYIWSNLEYIKEKDLSLNAILRLEESLNNSDLMYTFFERSSIISKVSNGGTIDETQRLQDEFNEATVTSGTILLPKNATILIKDTVTINEGINIIGNNTTFNPFIEVAGKELFNVATPERIKVEDIIINRLNGAVLPNSFKFDSAYINNNSEFKNVAFINMIDALNLDYVKNFTLDHCVFVRGQNGVKLGFIDANVNNVYLFKNRFEDVNLTAINTKVANNLVIENNLFKVDTGNFHNNRNIEVNLTAGTHNNLNIIGNKHQSFRAYAIYIECFNTANLNNVLISNNNIRDFSASTTSAPIVLASTANNFNNVNIQSNIMRNRQIGIFARNLNNLIVNGNNIVKETGTYAASRGYYIQNCTYLSKGNIIIDQALVNEISVGNTILTEY